MSQELENTFIELVDHSWKRHNEYLENRRTDDILVGGVIAAMVEDGHSLIDLTSDGTAHYLRFENFENKQRLIFRLSNRTEQLVAARVLGRHADVVIGYGEQVSNVGKLWQTLKSEIKSNLLVTGEPGVITTDADMTAGYLYVQVPLILDIDTYFDDANNINNDLIRQHINATVFSLRKYLHGRLSA